VVTLTPSRRLERECQRNIELIWLTGQLAPAFKTIADFRKDNGAAIREVCREFVALCRELDLLSAASVAIDGSKFKAGSTRASPAICRSLKPPTGMAMRCRRRRLRGCGASREAQGGDCPAKALHQTPRKSPGRASLWRRAGVSRRTLQRHCQ
jgi:hypothetical protein